MDYSTVAPKTCVLKINVHCEGCQKKVKKVLEKIHGVYSVNIDAEQGRVTVSGSVNPYILLEMLAKAGKKAQLLLDQARPPLSPSLLSLPPPPPPPGNNHNQLEFQFKSMHIAPPPSPSPPTGPVQQKSNGGPFDQLQQLARIKKLRHLELTQSRGMKLTFRGKKKGASHGDDQRMKLITTDGHGPQSGGGGPGPGPFGGGHVMNHLAHCGHEINATCGAGHSGVRSGEPSMNWHRPMPPPGPPTPLPPPPAPASLFTNMFSDEQPNGCKMM